MTNDVTIEQGIVMQRQGKFRAAADIYQQVLDNDPSNARALHYLGLVNYQLGELGVADRLMSRSLELDPSCANTWNDLGMVKVNTEQYEDALRFFSRALDLNRFHSDALNNKAITLKKLQRMDEALALFDKVAQLRPTSPQALCNLGDAQYKMNDVDAALRSFRKALKLDPSNNYARIGLGNACESIGKFKQARMQYLSVLRRDPDSPLVLSKLIQMREGDIDSKWVAKAHDLLKQSDTKPEAKIRLNIALGYYYDRRQEYDRAFGHLKLGNDEQFAKDPFDSDNFSIATDHLIDVLTAAFFEHAPRSKIHSRRPIFIVGMPRSGTTLTEQILASHSQVTAGGELSSLLKVSYQIKDVSYNGRPYPEGLMSIGRIGLSKLAHRYLNGLDKVSVSAKRVTDKLPFNFMHLGVIALLFPNAKVVHCRRQAMDNCLSCYFTSFADQIQFANNLETLGKYYLDYRRLMEHWHRVLPLQILDLQYEDLVSNTKTKVRELLDYCDLAWEDACLTFYQTKGSVKTPSRWQVRQPVYAHSVNRWKNYESHLQRLKVIVSGVEDLHVNSAPATRY